MMRVMVFVKATADSEKGFDLTAPEFQKSMQAMGEFNQELGRAGILKDGDCDGLKPSSFGKRIAFSGTDRKVIDGPFAHPNELVTGYWIWTVKDMDEAVMWAKRAPNPMPGPSELEIRPFYEMEDFE